MLFYDNEFDTNIKALEEYYICNKVIDGKQKRVAVKFILYLAIIQKL